MRDYLRQLFIFVMRCLGIIRLFQLFRRKQIVILMLHGVMDDRDGPSWRPLRPFLPRYKLGEYLRILSKRYHFVPLMDAVEMLKGSKPIEPYSMVLTFDEGYGNNVTHALPILRRYNAPATFFVPTGFLDNPRPFWFDRLDYAVQHAHVNGRELKVGSFTTCLDCSSKEALRKSFIRFIRAAQEQNMSDFKFLQEIHRLTLQLEAESGRSLSDIYAVDRWTAMMTWGQIENLGSDGVTIGSHTVDHVRLGHVDAQTARNQLARSKRDIEQHIDILCQSLAYPNGSFNEETVAIARECGYISGLTTKEGLNKPGDDLMRLRRIGLGINWSTTELSAVVSGLAFTLSRIAKCFSKQGIR
jgi:peptidoglycan/xylan/chitin deacetylase (PgdA/CDA1 family)